MNKKILLFLTPLYLFASNVSFQDALNLTLKNNKELKAKKLDIATNELNVKESTAYNYGQLQFNHNISRTNHAGYVFGMKTASREVVQSDFITQKLNHPTPRNNFETKISYELPLYTGGKLQKANEMAKLQVLATKAKYTYDKNKLGLEVLKAYNGAVASKEFIKATIKAKEATKSFVDFATALYEEGLVTSIDVKQSKVYDLDVDVKMLEAKNKYALALSYLKFLTNDANITDVDAFYEVKFKNNTLNKLQQSATINRADAKWMKLNTKTMQTKIEMEKSSGLPTIGAKIEVGNNDNSLDSFDGQHDYFLGAIGLSYTIFDAGLSSIKQQKAKILYEKTKNYYEYMKDGIKLEVEKNLLTLKTKIEVLKQKQKAQNLASEVLLQSQEMYKNHLINMSNLLLQQASSQKAQAQTIMAKYEKTMALAKLKISLGQTLSTK